MKIVYSLSRFAGYIATGVLGLMMLLTVADVLLRYFLSAPITGSTEITEFMMVIVVFPALAWCALTGKHVRVDLLVSYLPPRVQAIFSIITLLAALGTYIIITWQSFLESAVVNRQTSFLQLPFTPFYWVMSGGLALFCLAIVVLVIEDVAEALKR